jgi:superfamily II DNA/RNA helicase
MADELAGETLELVRRTGPAPGGPGAGGAENAALQTAACSATLTEKGMAKLLPLLGGAPRIVETDEQEILRNYIEHWAIFSEGRRKIQTLRSLLSAVKPKKALVFSDSGRNGGRGNEAGNIVAQLQYHKIRAAGLSGGSDKKMRKEAIDGFRSGKIPVLISTDLAARGLDIPGVTHVIALDVSANSEAYIHRAGRTARAGKRGIMITIGDAEEMRLLAALEKKLGIVVHPKELSDGRVLGMETEPSDE